MQVSAQKQIEQDLDADIRHREEQISKLQSTVQMLKQLKENPVIFEISEKYGVPVDKVTAIAQELRQTRIGNKLLKAVCIVPGRPGMSEFPSRVMHNKGISEAILTIMRQNPERSFTAKEMKQVMPKGFKPASIETTLSTLCIYKGALARENKEKPFKYRLKRRPNKEKKGVLREKLVSFLKAKKDFWHTSKSVSEETGLQKNYVSSTASVLASKGILERQVLGYAKLRHNATSKIPTYKFKLK